MALRTRYGLLLCQILWVLPAIPTRADSGAEQALAAPARGAARYAIHSDPAHSRAHEELIMMSLRKYLGHPRRNRLELMGVSIHNLSWSERDIYTFMNPLPIVLRQERHRNSAAGVWHEDSLVDLVRRKVRNAYDGVRALEDSVVQKRIPAHVLKTLLDQEAKIVISMSIVRRHLVIDVVDNGAGKYGPDTLEKSRQSIYLGGRGTSLNHLHSSMRANRGGFSLGIAGNKRNFQEGTLARLRIPFSSLTWKSEYYRRKAERLAKENA